MRFTALVSCCLTAGLLWGCLESQPRQSPVDAVKSPIVGGIIADGLSGVGAFIVQNEDGIYLGSFCSGTLIGSRWVLTAAHCMDREDEGTAHFFLGPDARMRLGGGPPAVGNLYPIAEVFIHPNWGEDRRARVIFDDIAVVRLGEDVVDVEPYALWRDSLSELVGDSVVHAGFGLSDPEEPSSGSIKRRAEMEMTMVAPVHYMLTQGPPAICSGDSGGPGLVMREGLWHVIGVNSAGVTSGDDAEGNCTLGSSHTRVDAYQTWIDDLMGVPVDCDGESECACEEACTNDGVCNPVRCTHDDCRVLRDCLRGCSGDLGPNCSSECAAQAGPAAWGRYQDMGRCRTENCPEGGIVCLREECNDEVRLCLGDEALAAGDWPCEDIWTCIRACDMEGCADECVRAGAPEAQTAFWDSFRCSRDCDGTACIVESCRDVFLACMPAEGCAIVGNTCGDNEACWPRAWGDTWCSPSGGAMVGEECVVIWPGIERPIEVSCSDGSYCWNQGGGPRCQENCVTDEDCRNPDAVCELYEGSPLEFGACVVECDDLDGDGSCDVDDCAPDDPRQNPLGDEVCGDEADNDCDERIDELCGLCPDVDEDGYCEDVDCVDTDDRINPGVAEDCATAVDDNCDGRVNESCIDLAMSDFDPGPTGGCDCRTSRGEPVGGSLWLGLLILLGMSTRRRPCHGDT